MDKEVAFETVRMTKQEAEALQNSGEGNVFVEAVERTTAEGQVGKTPAHLPLDQVHVLIDLLWNVTMKVRAEHPRADTAEVFRLGVYDLPPDSGTFKALKDFIMRYEPIARAVTSAIHTEEHIAMFHEMITLHEDMKSGKVSDHDKQDHMLPIADRYSKSRRPEGSSTEFKRTAPPPSPTAPGGAEP